MNIASSAGGMVSSAYNGSGIKYCTNYGNLKSNKTNGSSEIGGIAGLAYGLTISYCENYGKLYASSRVGGIAGTGADYAVFYMCKNYGYVEAYLTYAPAGICANLERNAFVSNCENYGHIKGGYAGGGIIGEPANSTVKYCKNFGKIEGESSMGGITGRIWSGCTFSYCENYGEIVATSNDNRFGGIFGYAWETNSKVTNCVSYCKMNLFNDSVYFGKERANWILDDYYQNCILVATGNDGVTKSVFYDNDFSAFCIDWKTGEIGLKALSGKGFFQGKVTEEILIGKGFERKYD